MKATENSTPSTLRTIINRLDREADFARGIEAAVRGLECLNEGQRSGVTTLIEAHIYQLDEISGVVWDVMQEAKVPLLAVPGH